MVGHTIKISREDIRVFLGTPTQTSDSDGIVKGDGRSFESIIGGQSNALRATRNARDPRRRLSYAVRPPRATRRQDPHGAAINLQSTPPPSMGALAEIGSPFGYAKMSESCFCTRSSSKSCCNYEESPQTASKRQMLLLLRCDFFSRSLYDGY
ncbi:hypothetical protein CEXT_161871 [Caerostris extrusa]|uniref:Uncharacterized protein n=1 Tax=Caerostris extrusa TaxID=172846 RepID=A0AAV4VTI5_CAEEX|nr:hypothetical protein CEXT_161871 [Caerostris extrusa]